MMASKQPVTTSNAASVPAVDAALLAGCRSGDRQAQQQIYELCSQRVYRLMVRMVDRQDAADLTQQVFLQVYRKIGQFEGLAKFETWLYRLAVNEALQHLRRGHRWRHEPLVQEPVSEHCSGHQRHEQKELLEQAIARLEPELRSIFLLREVEGLSYHDIAEAVAIPAGTVGSRLNRARTQLQEHLIELGWEP
ncbi:MAG: sigma-70 family RNA polymerase sigma factor [Planctomycetales bacterium]|nr:sigma-70 family RNA polymerase sigma factor [Planctomycetales bacterium]